MPGGYDQQAQGYGDVLNGNGDDIGDYSTDFGGNWLSINGDEGIWTVPAFAYYFPTRKNPSYRISLSCDLGSPEGCLRWLIKKESKISGEWVEDAGTGTNKLVKR